MIIGDGPERGPLEQLTHTLAIKGRVQFLGQVSDHEKFLALSRCDAFALTSLHDGYSLAILEAMHLGLPIITTDNGGQAELVSDNGIFVPPGKQINLSTLITMLMINPTVHQRMAEASRRNALEYSPEKTAKEYEDIYLKEGWTYNERV